MENIKERNRFAKKIYKLLKRAKSDAEFLSVLSHAIFIIHKATDNTD